MRLQGTTTAGRLVGWFWLGLAASGCESVAPEVLYSVLPSSSVDDPFELPSIAWNQEDFGDWSHIVMINETNFELLVGDVEIVDEGDDIPPTPGDGVDGWEDFKAGADLLELGEIDLPFATVPMRTRLILPVRFEPPLAGERTLWTSNTYKATIKFLVSPGAVLDPFTGLPITTSEDLPPAKVESVFVTYTLDCDLDNDGFDAYACSGTDCNDEIVAISPAADEACDDIDNNCREGVDERCAD